MHAEANAQALSRIHAVRPQWRAVVPASDAVKLPNFTLLHAGPPFDNHCNPSAAVRSSAVLCCLYEGWARDAAEAERLIASGKVRLECAQSYRVVTPLAAVVSPRTALVEVVDAHAPQARAWSMLSSGAGPQIRFGTRDLRVLDRLAWRDNVLAPALQAALQYGPIDLMSLAKAGIGNGDDLHARTTHASAALHSVLKAHVDDVEITHMLAQTPLFFLTLWMAACHLMLSAGQVCASTLVIALAGNGERVGIRLAGAPSRWVTIEGTPPHGPRIDASDTAEAARLTGDSGVIDAAGFGAQAFSSASEPVEALKAFLPDDWRETQPRIHSSPHPFFPDLPGVLDAARVVAEGTQAIAAIAMIAADGQSGLLGRGIYAAPTLLFEQAMAALSV